MIECLSHNLIGLLTISAVSRSLIFLPSPHSFQTWAFKLKSKKLNFNISVHTVQPLSRVQLSVTPWTAACQTSLSINNSQRLLKLMPLMLVRPSSHLLCHILLLLPSGFSSKRVFSNESVLHIRWPKYWTFSFSISSSNEYSGLISFRMGLLDLLAVQGTLKSLLQHHSSKASILQCSAFFIVQLSHPYMTTGKTIALTRWIFVDIVMSLLFNMLSRLVIDFLSRGKNLLISWLQSPSAVILEFKKIKSLTVSIVSPSICHEVMGLDAMILVFSILSFKPTFSLSYFIKRLFSSSLSPIRVVSCMYLRLLIFLPAILIPACASSSLAFHMMYSEYNKQGDNTQPWHTWDQSVVVLFGIEYLHLPEMFPHISLQSMHLSLLMPSTFSLQKPLSCCLLL